MKFSQLYFKKDDIKFVDEGDLTSAIISKLKSGSYESSSLELKSYAGVLNIREKYDEITKYVSALANNEHDGGILIFGINEKAAILTPFPLRKDKDAISQAIKSRLLVKDPGDIHVHNLNSSINPNSKYIIIEVVNNHNYPYYWGHLPKDDFTDYFPFVLKDEVGIKKIDLGKVHDLRHLEIDFICPQGGFVPLTYGVPSEYQPPVYECPINIGIKNIGRIPVTNCRLALIVRSINLTLDNSLLFRPNGLLSVENLRKNEKKLSGIINQRTGKNVRAEYHTHTKPNGDLIKIDFLDSFALAQDQQFTVPFSLLVQIGWGRVPVDINFIFSSNETGRQEKEKTLVFFNRP